MQKNKMITFAVLSLTAISLSISAPAAPAFAALAFADKPNIAVTEMPEFTAKDLEGNEITEAVFSEKDVTMINIWGTFCSPCVGEMPELAEISENMPENQQMLGLIIDVADESDSNYELAKQILEKAGASYSQIIANDDFADFLNYIAAVPTTVFVDKEGNILGDAVVGADVDGYKQRLEKYAEQFPVTEASSKKEAGDANE